MKSFAQLVKSLMLAAIFSFTMNAMAADQVDINSADATTIAETLNGVGMAKAQAIVDYRTQHGPFKSIDQLAEVKGIGLKTVEKNRDRIVLGATAETPAATQ